MMDQERRIWKIGTLMTAALALVSLALACDIQPSTRDQDEKRTADMMREMRAQVGLPNITNFTEAKFARQIAELRDQSIRTWTYYVDINGARHLLCESVGYALPYSVQLTNPMERVWEGTILPLAEPNGLYMPESAEASWVMCSDGKGAIAPVYSETRLIVSPFPLGHATQTTGSGWDEQVEIQKLDTEMRLQGSE